MDYSTLSDAEINQAVTCALNPETRKMALIGDGSCFYDCGPDGSQFYEIPIHDYCNNPADAWPIIEKHGITLAFDGSDWWATSDACWVDGCEWQIEGEISRKPLRAAMIVFLMMQESE